MKQNHHPQLAATSVADTLVKSWLRLHAHPGFIKALQTFSRELDLALKTKLPDGILRGVMRGMEAEIRQDAAILLLDRYFAGNRKLVAETALGNLPEISNQLDRSIAAAIAVCRRRLGHRNQERTKLEQELQSDDPRLPSVDGSPTQGLWQLPFALRHAVALKLLKMSVDSGETKENAAQLIVAILSGEMTQAELSQKLGVSRSAVSQKVRATTVRLRRMVNDIEFGEP